MVFNGLCPKAVRSGRLFKFKMSEVLDLQRIPAVASDVADRRERRVERQGRKEKQHSDDDIESQVGAHGLAQTPQVCFTPGAQVIHTSSYHGYRA